MSLIRVLVVEDFKPWRSFVVSMIRKNPLFRVIGEALDGLEAVQKSEELKPDLILLDIGIPELNGIDAARQIRSLSPQSTILFLSQESSPDVVREALKIGLGFVVKTDAAKELLSAVNAVIQGNQFLSSRLVDHSTDALDTPTNRKARKRKEPVSLATGQALLQDM
jgi:DNA-binding NarL/FixJ family response regulator